MITRIQVYKDIVKTMYEYFINAGYDENYSMRWANINAVKLTDKEYYRRLKQ